MSHRYEDYRVGLEVVSPYRRILETDVAGIAQFTNDVRPLMNFDRPDDGPLTASPLHGFSLGLCLLLHASPVPYIPDGFVAFLGFDSIGFREDVRVGDVIRSVAIVDEMDERRSMGSITYRHRVEKHDGEIVARSRHSILVRREVSS